MHRFSLTLAGAAACAVAGVSAAHAYEGSFFFDPPPRPTQAAVQRPAQVAAVPQNEPSAEPEAASPYYADPYAGTGSRPSMSPIPREMVDYDGPYSAGTIVVSTTEKRLYLVMPNHQALRYGVGVGRPGFEWSGTKTITAKREWPDWTPPAAMLRRRPDLPRHMEGGIDNPLGARAMYLGGSEFRIHGSNEPDTIGQAVSSGCIRMTNEDVADLYDRVKVGTRAIIER